jgi:hypothetical protein
MPRKKKTEYSRSIVKGQDPEDVVLRQDLFLESYSRLGSIRAVVEEIKISRSTYYEWQKNDKYGFAERFETAKHEFREMLQDMAVNRVKEQKASANPLLLITLLNAHWSEKYKPRDSGADETAKETLKELRDKFKFVTRTEEEVEDSKTALQQAKDVIEGKKSD